MRLSRGNSAFTLIELLIVVAIIAIFAASSLSVVTAPAEEQAFSIIDEHFESGTNLFFTHFVADAHDAESLRVIENPPALILTQAGETNSAVAYFVDSRHQLRRAILSGDELAALATRGERGALEYRGAVLIEAVVELRAEKQESTGLWRVSLHARSTRLDREINVNRHVDVCVGHSWLGGAQ